MEGEEKYSGVGGLPISNQVFCFILLIPGYITLITHSNFPLLYSFIFWSLTISFIYFYLLYSFILLFTFSQLHTPSSSLRPPIRFGGDQQPKLVSYLSRIRGALFVFQFGGLEALEKAIYVPLWGEGHDDIRAVSPPKKR